jgi:hypothetical protein
MRVGRDIRTCVHWSGGRTTAPAVLKTIEFEIYRATSDVITSELDAHAQPLRACATMLARIRSRRRSLPLKMSCLERAGFLMDQRDDVVELKSFISKSL